MDNILGILVYSILWVLMDPVVKGKTNPSLLLLLSFWVPSGPTRKGQGGKESAQPTEIL